MRAHLFSLVLILSSVGVYSQTNDPVIMTLNDKSFKKSEFEYFYNKYNNEDVIDKRSLEEYIDLFKNLKLKVAEAETQGLDKTNTFMTELSEYRSIESKPYLEQPEINEEYVRTKYERMKELVEISHILIAFPGVKNNNYKIFPSDTLESFKKAEQIRNRLLKGEDFGKLAKEFSDDTNSAQREQPGYLGSYSGLDLFPIFEEAAFNTPVGSVGQLVRTNMGYHIIKVLSKKANPGQVQAAHILIQVPNNADAPTADAALKKINEIYNDLLNGADFAALAKEHSQDPGSAAKGGDLDWFGRNVMVKEFQDAAFDLKEVGNISKPIKTQFGYHIIKLLGKKSIEPYEEKRNEIESKLNSGGFLVTLVKPEIEKMKKNYGFQKNEAGYKMLFSRANTIYPADSIFYSDIKTDNSALFTIGNTSYSIAQFVDFLKNNIRSPFILSNELLDNRLQTFEYNSLSEAKDKELENKNPEFKNLVQEYRDGILMFEISNKEIWSKASEDTKGLSEYFNKNKQKYSWTEPHYKGYVIFVKDTSTKKKMQKEVARKKPDEAVQYLYENYKVGDVSYVKAEKGLYKKGENPFVDEVIFKSGKAELTPEFQDFFLIGQLLKAPESYSDVRGVVITDYQNFLEDEWLKKLNEKYKVVVFPEVIKR